MQDKDQMAVSACVVYPQVTQHQSNQQGSQQFQKKTKGNGRPLAHFSGGALLTRREPKEKPSYFSGRKAAAIEMDIEYDR